MDVVYWKKIVKTGIWSSSLQLIKTELKITADLQTGLLFAPVEQTLVDGPIIFNSEDGVNKYLCKRE